MTRTRRIITACAAALFYGCAPATVAPTAQTVFTTVDRILTGPAHLVFVENRSSVPVTVYSFTLRECTNVKGPCSVRPLDVHVAPGARVQMARVDPGDPEKGFTYRYSFGWRADSGATAALSTLASTGDASARRQLEAIRLADTRHRYESGSHSRELSLVELASLASAGGSLRPEPDSLVLGVGERVPLDTIRVFLVGENNEILGRIRVLEWELPSGAAALLEPDTVIARTPGRASLLLKLPNDVLPERPALHTVVRVPIVVRP